MTEPVWRSEMQQMCVFLAEKIFYFKPGMEEALYLSCYGRKGGQAAISHPKFLRGETT